MPRSNRPSRRFVTPVLALAVGAASLTLGGCYDPNNVSYNYITGHLSPHLMGLSERDVDVQRNVALTLDTNMRMIWGDLGRMSLLDSPTTLYPTYIYSTNGQSR